MEIEDILGEEGSLSREHPSYEHREGQIEMARAVFEAFAGEHSLIVEAGTGTGKTVAYLTAGILSERNFVISTAKRNLQEQLFYKDLPLIKKCIPTKIKVALLKGRTNYLCLFRFRSFQEEALILDKGETRLLNRIKRWAGKTGRGDFAEVEELPEDHPFTWQINARADTCLGTKCPDYGDCFLYRARKEARESDVVVVNHHLLFSDIAVKDTNFGEILPDYDYLVIDEAHKIEEIASHYFGKRISNYRLRELVSDLQKESEGKREKPDLLEDSERLKRVSDRFFSFFDGKEGRSLFQGSMKKKLSPLYKDFTASLEVLSHSLEPFRDESEIWANLYRRTGEILSETDFIVNNESDDYGSWFEVRGRSIYLQASPIEVSELLERHLFSHLRSAVLTSATLSTGKTFEYIKNRTGLRHARELIIPTHFDLESQVLFYLPRRIPDPRDEGFLSRASEIVAELLAITEGRAFLLCTSFQNLNAFKSLLEGNVPYPLLAQGEAPKSALLEKFRNDDHPVLVATSSFWEGVDVQGPNLSCVIIDRLPFDVPTDPLTSARIKKIRDQGGSPFYDYQLPLAVIELKQGLGRLIRSRNDYGLLSVLDKRLWTKSYGRFFFSSLPAYPVTRETEAQGKPLPLAPRSDPSGRAAPDPARRLRAGPGRRRGPRGGRSYRRRSVGRIHPFPPERPAPPRPGGDGRHRYGDGRKNIAPVANAAPRLHSFHPSDRGERDESASPVSRRPFPGRGRPRGRNDSPPLRPVDRPSLFDRRREQNGPLSGNRLRPREPEKEGGLELRRRRGRSGLSPGHAHLLEGPGTDPGSQGALGVGPLRRLPVEPRRRPDRRLYLRAPVTARREPSPLPLRRRRSPILLLVPFQLEKSAPSSEIQRPGRSVALNAGRGRKMAGRGIGSGDRGGKSGGGRLSESLVDVDVTYGHQENLLERRAGKAGLARLGDVID
jgi:ATP-dependent DNA helicase DinG